MVGPQLRMTAVVRRRGVAVTRGHTIDEIAGGGRRAPIKTVKRAEVGRHHISGSRALGSKSDQSADEAALSSQSHLGAAGKRGSSRSTANL